MPWSRVPDQRRDEPDNAPTSPPIDPRLHGQPDDWVNGRESRRAGPPARPAPAPPPGPRPPPPGPPPPGPPPPRTPPPRPPRHTTTRHTTIRRPTHRTATRRPTGVSPTLPRAKSHPPARARRAGSTAAPRSDTSM